MSYIFLFTSYPTSDVRVNFFHSKHMFRVIDTITSRWSSRWRGIDKTSTIFTMFWHFLQCQDKSNRLCSISGHSGQNIFGNQFFRFFNRLLVPSKPQYLLNNFPKILKIKTSFWNDIWIGYFLINSTFKLKQPHMLFSPWRNRKKNIYLCADNFSESFFNFSQVFDVHGLYERFTDEYFGVRILRCYLKCNRMK